MNEDQRNTALNKAIKKIAQAYPKVSDDAIKACFDSVLLINEAKKCSVIADNKLYIDMIYDIVLLKLKLPEPAWYNLYNWATKRMLYFIITIFVDLVNEEMNV